MRSIYKYPLSEGAAETVLNIPRGFIPRRFAMRHRTPTLWAEVETNERAVSTTVRIIGTGDSIPENAHYIGSCEDGPRIWHLFQMIG